MGTQRMVRTVVTALVTFVAVVALGAAPASAALSDVGPADADTGLPTYYQDDTGLRLQPCLTDPVLCVTGSTVPDPTAPPSVYTGNLGPEEFYYAADARIAMPGGGQALLTVGLENSWTSTTQCGKGLCPEPGKQAVFGRVRFRIDGLTPGLRYTVRYPWGTQDVTAVATTNGVRSVNLTIDTGCAATAGALPCDPRLALGAIVGPFLGWDPAVAPAAPDGFLGSYAVPHPITGSRVLGPDGLPQNYFSVEGPDLPRVRTDLFQVAGQVARPAVVDPVPPTPPAPPAPPATVPPTAPGAVVPQLPATALGTADVPVQLGWGPATAPAGVAGYDLSLTSPDGGTATTAATAGTTATTTVAAGHRYDAAVRARTATGVVGDWTRTSFAVAVPQENDPAIRYSKGWSRKKLAGASGGSTEVTSTAGATATFRFTGTAVAWAATLGPGRGVATASLDGSPLPGTVDLRATTVTPRRLVLARAGLAAGAHTLTVTLPTGGKGKAAASMDVDAFAVLAP